MSKHRSAMGKQRLGRDTSFLDILVILDIEAVIRDRPIYSGSVPNMSRPIKIDSKYSQMIVTKVDQVVSFVSENMEATISNIHREYKNGINRACYAIQPGEKTEILAVTPGDILSLKGVSITQNSKDAIMIYNVEHLDGDNVFNPFNYSKFQRNAAVMPGSYANVLPAQHCIKIFSSITSTASQAGNGLFQMDFATYTIKGNEHVLYGYYGIEFPFTVL